MFTTAFLRDATERVAATYLQAFLGLLIAGTTVINISAVQSAAVAAIPAGLAVLKAMLATQVGGPGASLDAGLMTVDTENPRDAAGNLLTSVPDGAVVSYPPGHFSLGADTGPGNVGHGG